MSAPYGPAQPRPAAPSPVSDGPDLKFILTLVAAGAGPVGYLLGFLDAHTAGTLAQLPGFSFVLAAALAGLRVLPSAPGQLIYAALPLAIYSVLGVLQSITSGAGGMVVVLLLLAIVQLAALVLVLLWESGIVEPPKPKSGPPRSGQFHPPAPAGPFTQQPGPPQQQPGGWNPPSAPGPQPGGRPQPPTTGPQPPVTGPQPPVTGPQPPVTGPQPPVTGPQPPVTGPQPTQSAPGPQQGPPPASGPQGTQQMPHPGQQGTL